MDEVSGMPLTPQDVSNKRFTPVRLREGYDMGEVDQFLDEVETELARLLKENEELRSRAGSASAGAGDADKAAQEKADADKAAAATAAQEKADAEKAAQEEADAEKAGTQETAAAPLRPSEQIKVTTTAEASAAATRLLELATSNADQVVAEAHEEAQQIVGTARTEAEKLRGDATKESEELRASSRSEADRVAEEARGRAQRLDEETEGRRRSALDDIEREKSRLDGEVENLRAFEREYRSRLRSYFTQQLEALDAEGGDLDGGAPGEDGRQPKRLKSILGAASEHVQGQQGSEGGAPANAPAEQDAQHDQGSATPGEEQPRS